MKFIAISLIYLAGAVSAAAADLDLNLPTGAAQVITGPAPVVAGPALVPPCREAWFADLLRCRRPVLVDPRSPAAREQLQTVERRAKPYPELFSWSH